MAKLAGIEYTRRLSDDETSKFLFCVFGNISYEAVKRSFLAKFYCDNFVSHSRRV